jgi:uracil-DNA glycosylase family 4
MVVCEAPSGKEDLLGGILVGKGGQLLDSLLGDAGISIHTVFKSNAVRCRPPRNHKPLPGEIETCRGHLKAEIHRVKPKQIVAMGDIALKSLCKKSGVSNKRGKDISLHSYFEYTCPVWVTYSPKLILMQPLARTTIVNDLRRVKDGILGPEEIEWKWWDTKRLDGDVWAYDIETTSLEIKPGTVTQWAVSDGSRVVVERSYPIAGAQRLLALYGKDRRLVGHNSWAFDAPVLQSNGVEIPLGDDTAAYAYLLDETQPKGLEALAQKYLGVRGWKEDSDAQPGSDTFAAYNARDAKYTWELDRVLREKLGDRLRIYEYILKPGREALNACSRRGIYICTSSVAAADEHYGGRMAAVTQRLRDLSGDENFNARSGKCVVQHLLADGHTLSTLTDGGSLSVAKKVLLELKHTPLVEALLEHSSIATLYSSFVKPYKILPGIEGRIHPTYKILSTLTGRTSASKPNTQNLPKDKRLRSFFSAPDGSIRAEFDYKGEEFRLALYIAGEFEILRKITEEGFDPYRALTAQYLGKPVEEVTDAERQVGKSATLGLLFRGTEETLEEYLAKQDPPIRLPKVGYTRIYRAFHRMYRKFFPWYYRTREQIKNQGYVESLTGRRRHFGDYGILDRKRQKECLREGVNFQVQSLAADIGLVALSLCNVAGLPITDFWHDAVGFEFVAEDFTPVVAAKIARLMTTETLSYLHKHFGVPLDLPLEVEMKEN